MYSLNFKLYIILFFVSLFSSVLLYVSPTIVFHLNELLPLSAKVRSAGTYYPAFSDTGGYIRQLYAVPVALYLTFFLLVFIIKYNHVYSKIETYVQDNYIIICSILIFIIFATYAYIAYPPNFFPANAYHHWVRNLYDINISRSYTAVFILHYLFYDYPHILQGILGSLIFIVTFFIFNTADLKKLSSIALALSVSFSSHVMNFISISEDTLIIQLLVLICLYFYIKRLNYFTGLSFFLLSLGRPQLVVVVLAFIVVELFYNNKPFLYSFKYIKDFFLKNHFISSNLFLFFVLLFFREILAILIPGFYGPLYNILSSFNKFAVEVTPIAVDGFTIYKMSLAYFLHFLWIMPSAFFIILVYFLFLSRKKNTPFLDSTILFFLLTLISIILHEIATAFYFNYRYLSYFIPSLTITAILLIVGNINSRNKICLFFLLVLISITPIMQNNDSISTKISSSQSELHQLYQYRKFLRRISANDNVYTSFSKRSEIVYLSYVFQKPRFKYPKSPRIFRDQTTENLPFNSIFVTRKSVDSYHGKCILVETEDFIIFKTCK
jgi:hypothetical protein